jgi:hypothetical protein
LYFIQELKQLISINVTTVITNYIEINDTTGFYEFAYYIEGTTEKVYKFLKPVPVSLAKGENGKIVLLRL